MRSALVLGAALLLLPSCERLERFDTSGPAAYCGTVVGAQFIRTTEAEGGFARDLRLQLEVDGGQLSVSPGTITTDDGAAGPCAPSPLFDQAPLRVTPEIVSDSLSTLQFEEGQVHNVVAWVTSSCRGPMLAIVSLYKNDRVAVRLLKPGTPGSTATQDAFALFPMTRSETGCGY